MINLIFDADMLCYRAASSCEHEIDWGNDLWTLHSDLKECQQKFMSIYEEIMTNLRKHVELEGYEVTMCFTDRNNFRKLVLPSYKSNRKATRKPVAYSGLVQWVHENFHTESRAYLEADDLCSLLSKPGDILVSADKDFQTIPERLFYNYHKDELKYNTREAADYFWYYQCLVGDVTDGYKGLEKCGPKGAEKILKDCTWDAVVGAYVDKGYTEEDALVQARVARILREGDYSNGVINLWSPRENLRKSIDTKAEPVVY